MEKILVGNEKVTLKFTDEELVLLGNSLNEVCHGFGLIEFDSKIGISIEEAEILLKFINSSYRKCKQLKLDEWNE